MRNINENVYNHKSLLIKKKRAEEIIVKLFNYFETNPNKLPEDWKNINILEGILIFTSGFLMAVDFNDKE